MSLKVLFALSICGKLYVSQRNEGRARTSSLSVASVLLTLKRALSAIEVLTRCESSKNPNKTAKLIWFVIVVSIKQCVYFEG